jgi:hypothetical protein
VKTSIFYFLIGNHTRVTKIKPKVNWLCALGNLDAFCIAWTPPKAVCIQQKIPNLESSQGNLAQELEGEILSLFSGMYTK